MLHACEHLTQQAVWGVGGAATVQKGNGTMAAQHSILQLQASPSRLYGGWDEQPLCRKAHAGSSTRRVPGAARATGHPGWGATSTSYCRRCAAEGPGVGAALAAGALAAAVLALTASAQTAFPSALAALQS